MAEFQVGEVVDITIKGARVVSHGNDVLTVDHQILREPWNGNWRRVHLCTLSDAVTVERVAPAYWPPQQGDVWSSVEPVLWFAHLGPAGYLTLVNQAGAMLTVEEFGNGYAGRLVLRDGRVPEAVA